MPEIGPISYDRKNLLGEGGFGFVFRGTFRDGESGEESTVAVKQIQHGNVNTDEREVDALKKLRDHPNVIRLYGTEKDEHFHYFALELCAASIYDIFREDNDPKKYKGPLPSDLDALLQLSEGLHYIHSKGFVHRDVKPENFLISYPKRDGTVEMKWSDFGLSKSVSSRGTFSISGIKGTINWIAPEILATLGLNESKPRGTVESDTWSFGCVAFAYLTRGKHPFGDSDITRNILDANPINLSELPQDHFAGNIIKEMIQKETKERIKLIDVVKILAKVKAEEPSQQEQDDNASRELEAGQLYSWEQWNLILKNGELFIWSDDVGIEGFPLFHDETIRMKLNHTDKMRIASISYYGWFKVEETAGRKEGELNKEMFQLAGITPGTPSRSPLNTHFTSRERRWTVCPSMLRNTLIIKGEESRGHRNWEMTLFGTLFHSMVHIITGGEDQPTVYMTEKAKLALENELLDLCSRPSLETKEFDRISVLLQARIDPNCTDTDGKTPLLLSLAKQGGQTRLQSLKILLKSASNDSDLKIDFNVKDRQERNAFQLLLSTSKAERDPTVYESLKLLVNSGIDVNLKNKNGRTALHHLCKNYKVENITEAMKLLLAKDIDVGVVDYYSERTALHFLCESYKNENIVDAIKLLFIKKGNKNYVNLRDKNGNRALHYLCKNYKNENIVDAMKLLVENGVNVNLTDAFFRTPLHFLCECYNKENIVDAANVLIEKGADVNSKDGNGRSILYYLSKNHGNDNVVAVMNLLIEKGVDCKFQDQFGCTALHYVCENYTNENIVDAIKLLLDKGVGVNLKDKSERTALHYLCENYKNDNIVEVVELLVDKGVDIHLEDRDGKTALDYLVRDPKMAVWKEKFSEKGNETYAGKSHVIKKPTDQRSGNSQKQSRKRKSMLNGDGDDPADTEVPDFQSMEQN